jgi:hypothetical protein
MAMLAESDESVTNVSIAVGFDEEFILSIVHAL